MRALRRVLIGLVVLAVLLVVADRVAAWVAQRAVAEHVATELASYQVASQPPEVTVGGWPFLTQVAAGRFRSVTLRLRDVGSGELRLPLVELVATGVTADADTLIERQGPINADQVDGSATIGYASVTALTEFPELELSPAADGGLRVRLPTDVAGQPMTVTGSAAAEVADGVIRIQAGELGVEGQDEPPPGTPPVLADVASRLSVEVPLPPLPYGLTVESVRAESSGLVVSVRAANVPLAR